MIKVFKLETFNGSGQIPVLSSSQNQLSLQMKLLLLYDLASQLKPMSYKKANTGTRREFTITNSH